MTIQQMEDKSPEEQKGILSKSFDLWKKMALSAPNVIMETIKDPKKQVENLQNQIQQVGESITQQVGEKIAETVDVDDIRNASKSDYKNLMEMMEKMSKEMVKLNKKVNQLSKKEK